MGDAKLVSGGEIDDKHLSSSKVCTTNKYRASICPLSLSHSLSAVRLTEVLREYKLIHVEAFFLSIKKSSVIISEEERRKGGTSMTFLTSVRPPKSSSNTFLRLFISNWEMLLNRTNFVF